MSVNIDKSLWRLTTLGGVPLKFESHKGTVSEEDASMTETYVLKAEDLDDFLTETFPAPTLYLNGLLYPAKRKAPGTTLQTTTVSYESLTGKPIDPWNADTGAPAGTYDDDIRITVEYETSPTNDQDPDPNNPLTFLEISANASGSFLAVEARFADWQPPPFPTGGAAVPVTEIDVPQTLTETETEWSVRWSQIPWGFIDATLLGRLRTKLGTVNNAPMTLFHAAPTETVLFLGYSYRQQFTWRPGNAGQPPIELELKFLERNFTTNFGERVTHNHLYRPGFGYQRMTVNGRPLYLQSDLDAIFAP